MQPLVRCTFVLFSVLFILLAVDNFNSRKIYTKTKHYNITREHVISSPPRCDAKPFVEPVSAMHPATALYLERYRHTLRSGTSSKYLYFVPIQGVGNRMLGLVSAFVIALLTNRKLIIGWEGINQLFEQPFGDIYNWQADSSIVPPPNSPTLTIDHGAGSRTGWQTISCGFLDDQSPWLILSSNQYFLPMLFSNPNLRVRLAAIFPDAADVFSPLVRYLFQPSKRLKWDIDLYYNSSFTNHVIGLHYRSTSNKHEVFIDKMCLDCLGLQSITNCTRIYLASIHPEAFAAITDKYKVIGSPGGPEVHNFNNDWRALVDIYLLVRSTTFLASAYSTFGYIVSGLSGKNPIMIPVASALGNYQPDRRACWPSPSYEACAHMMSPFYYPLVLQGLCNPEISVLSERMSDEYKYC